METTPIRLTGADRGVRFAADAQGDGIVQGNGSILFELDTAITSGAVNYGGLAWDVEQRFDIDNFTVDFSLTNGPLTELAYVLIDYSHLNGLLSGSTDVFASVNNTPIGYELDYQTNDQIRLVSTTSAVPEPTAFTLFGFWAIGIVGRRRRNSRYYI